MADTQLDKDELKAKNDVSQGALDQVAKMISAINPEFIEKTGQDTVRDLLKKGNFWQAVNAAKPGTINMGDYALNYESTSETLEPIYFWILDYAKKIGLKVEKLVDNFASSVGSGHFSEMGAKASKMQEEAMKVMQTIGILVKSLINIVYDLREFEIRLGHYKAANSKNKSEAEAGALALKQIWMDNVDIKRGNGSINAMAAGNLQFVTLRDAFMIANKVEDVKGLDLNDRVKRILEPRLLEFIKWREISEKELLKRYEIERNYLKSQVASLKMYTRWVKPYLQAANQLEMMNFRPGFKDPAMVNAFNTMILQLSLLCKADVNPAELSVDKELPFTFRNMKFKREYASYVLIDFYFRGIPQKAGQHYVFGGRVEVKFRAFALNSQEVDLLKKKLDESDLKEGLNIAEGMTTESLELLREDIEYFLKEPDQREKEESGESEGEDTNPFLALVGMGGSKKKDKKSDKSDKKKDEITKPGDIKSDSYTESVLRKLAQQAANDKCYNIYDVYKKGHDMASLTGGYQDDQMIKRIDIGPSW